MVAKVVNAVAVVPASVAPTPLDLRTIVPAVAGVTAAAVAIPIPIPKDVAVVLEMATWRSRSKRPVPSACADGTNCTIAPPAATTEVLTFANPAVTFARSLSNSFSGIAQRDVPMFVLAQVAGAALATIAAAGLGWHPTSAEEPSLAGHLEDGNP